VNTPSGVVRGWCNDLSEGGIGAITSGALQLEQAVQLHVELPSGESLHLNAVVRCANGFRYGFEFVGLTDEQKALIQRFLSSS